jgi:hypothetical protein
VTTPRPVVAFRLPAWFLASILALLAVQVFLSAWLLFEIRSVLREELPPVPDVRFGVHLSSSPEESAPLLCVLVGWSSELGSACSWPVPSAGPLLSPLWATKAAPVAPVVSLVSSPRARGGYLSTMNFQFALSYRVL